MITVSLCMIVKNEERILRRCLDTVADLVDEIVIVDTGSTDRTKEIAAQYTENVFDFVWTGNFSDARNFAFSKCTMAYIYTADADEVIDQENRKRFRDLKHVLLPEIEIVQMKYGNQLQYSTIYNFDEEYRPKLYKRLREFVWEYPIHEAVRLTPVIYDSDIVITHLPEALHTGRDIAAFEKMTAAGEYLDRKLCGLYARELFISGSAEQVIGAREYFKRVIEEEGRTPAEQMEAFCIVVRAWPEIRRIFINMPCVPRLPMRNCLRRSVTNWDASTGREGICRRPPCGFTMRSMRRRAFWIKGAAGSLPGRD